MKKVMMYTDGGVYPNPGLGSWAVVLLYKGIEEKRLSGCEEDSTNSRMELRAVIEGLRALNQPCEVTIYTDSQYVAHGFTAVHKWKRRHWNGASGNTVKNQDLWEMLLEVSAKHTVKICWIKGHSGNHYNEIADTLCTEARQAFLNDSAQ